MEKVSFAPLSDAVPLRGKILTGVFKSQPEEAKICGAFSKFLTTGFEVLHVGINVHNSVFIQQMKKFSPHVLVLLCQGNIGRVKRLIEAIKEEEIRSMARIILYGSNIDESVRDEVHADAYAESEQDLFDMVKGIVSEMFH